MTLPLALLLAQTPAGFRPVAHQGVANDSQKPAREWQISTTNGRLRIESRIEWARRTTAEAKRWKPNPGSVKVPLANARATWSPGEGARVTDGWIKGFDAGEFGGGLYWFSADGKRSQRINGDNTDVVETFAQGTFAVQSLSHLMFWYSRLVKAERGSKGWRSSTVTDLHVPPVAVVRDGGRFVYVTGEYVSALETDGRQRELFRWLWAFRPTTMVRLANGDLWLGGERAVLRLRPRPDGRYADQWYVPLK